MLFADEAELPAYAEQLVAEAPADTSPLAIILEGLRAVAEARFEGRKDTIRQWRAIVATDAGLRERELQKRATLAAALRNGLHARGLDPTRAALLAETSATLMYVSVTAWLETDDDRKLYDIIESTLATLQATLDA